MERIARKEPQAQLMEAAIHHMEAIVNHLSEEMTTLDQYERLVQTQMHQLGNEIMQDLVGQQTNELDEKRAKKEKSREKRATRERGPKNARKGEYPKEKRRQV